MLSDNIDKLNVEGSVIRRCLKATVKASTGSTRFAGKVLKLLCLLPCLFKVNGVDGVSVTSHIVGTHK